MKHIFDFASSPYGIICMAVSTYVLFVAVWNLVYKLRIPKKTDRLTGPLVSVCIPARDEEKNIGRCLDSLLRQSYKNIEIIVCDDDSSDATWDILKGYADKFSRIKVIQAGEKPASWKGKSYALQQCADIAGGEILYTTDADTVHSRNAVAWAVDRLEKRNLDAFTAMPRQITETFAEKLVVPVVYIPAFFAPFALLNAQRLKSAVFAIGQLFVYRAEAFHAVGGMEPVRSKITDDVAMARVLREAGYRYEFLDARGHVECRMYGNFSASIQGFLKNFFEILSAAPLLIFSILFTGVITLFVIPPIFVIGSMTAASISVFQGGTVFLLPVLIIVLSWGINLLYYRAHFYIVFLYPVFFIIMAAMVCITVVHIFTGRQPVWKTRVMGASP